MKGIRPKTHVPRRDAMCRLYAAVALATGVAGHVSAGNDTRGLAKQGAEVAVAPPSSAEQTASKIALGANGGLIVWQDNAIDGDSSGIAAVILGKSWQATSSSFAVNPGRAGEQTSPDVALQEDGSALVVWRTGDSLNGRIVGRLISAAGKFATGEIEISGTGRPDALTPSVAALKGGGFCVVWAERETGKPTQDVYFRTIASNGSVTGSARIANQYVALNQRTPAVVGDKSGGFFVSWVSEDQTGNDSVDVFARHFGASGDAQNDEVRINSSANVCANPTLIALRDGRIVAAWSDLEAGGSRRGWDVLSRVISTDGTPESTPKTVNVHQNGYQYRPRLALSDSGAIVAWTSMGQDGWGEGVFARLLEPDGTPAGDELQVNSTWKGRQFEPSVASTGTGEALVVWSSYSADAAGVNLASQRINLGAVSLEPLPAPYVSALSATRVSITWPTPQGVSVSSYEIYFDGATSPETLTGNIWTSKALAPSSIHTARLGYVLSDGRKGPPSAAVEVATWGEDANGDGLPDDWQTLYWGSDPAKWPAPNADGDNDGVDNRSEFLAGTNPRNFASALRVSVEADTTGHRLNWNTQPGFIYQVYSSTDLSNWTTVDGNRFAAGELDSVVLPNGSSNSFYRVTRVR